MWSIIDLNLIQLYMGEINEEMWKMWSRLSLWQRL